MDANPQALAARGGLPSCDGGPKNRASILLHRVAVAGVLHAELGLGAFVKIAAGEGGHGGRLLALPGCPDMAGHGGGLGVVAARAWGSVAWRSCEGEAMPA